MADSASDNESNENGNDKHSSSSQNRSELEKRLSELDKKISNARGPEENPETLDKGKSYSYAFRIASELIAAPIVGAFIGWWIDRLLGTTPLLLLILLVLGMVAGIINVMRTAKEMQKKYGSSQNSDTEIK